MEAILFSLAYISSLSFKHKKYSQIVLNFTRDIGTDKAKVIQ